MGRPTKVAFFLFSTCLLSLVSLAQQRGMQVITAAPTTMAPQRWAILIGINRYGDSGLSNLNFAVADARALQETLIGMEDGFPAANTVLLIDDAAESERHPGRNNIIAQLTSWLQLPGPDDTVLLYFAGHGVEQDGISYLLPQDAKTANLGLTALRLSYFKEMLGQSPARKWSPCSAGRFEQSWPGNSQ